jgi:uncharacterized repeat protein (TIGR01451 family)
MGLEDLNQELYSRDHADGHKHDLTPYDPEALEKKNISHLQIDGEEWQPASLHQTRGEKFMLWQAEHRRAILASFGGALLAALLVAGGWYWFFSFFAEARVMLLFQSPESVKSGELTTLSIDIANDNKAVLQDVKIVLEHDSVFVPDIPAPGWSFQGERGEVKIGELGPGAKKTLKLSGKFFASKGTTTPLKARLEYTPKNISGVYTKESAVAVRVDSSPLTLTVNAPQSLVTGQNLDYELIYRNEGNETLDNVRVRVDLPSGFTFAGAEPGTSARDTWNLSTFRPGMSGKIVVHGKLEGTYNENKEVRFRLGYETGSGTFVSYNEGVATTRITASPLSVKQSVNDQAETVANAGDILSYAVEYKNSGERGLRDVIMSMTFENPEFLDWENLDLPRGIFDEATRSLIWKASDIGEFKSLAPGQSGTLTFSVPVVKDFSGQGQVKNKVIVSQVKIDSPDVAATLDQNKIIGSSTLGVKLGTLVGVTVLGYHNDDIFHNTGPVPPEVGEETSYTLMWRVTNPLNELTQAKLTATLPGYIKWKNTKTPEGESVAYNERANELVWNIGSMGAGSTKEVSLQVFFTPSRNQIDRDFLLLDKALLTGEDTFAKKVINLPVSSKNSYLPEDPSLTGNHNKVQKGNN